MNVLLALRDPARPFFSERRAFHPSHVWSDPERVGAQNIYFKGYNNIINNSV